MNSLATLLLFVGSGILGFGAPGALGIWTDAECREKTQGDPVTYDLTCDDDILCNDQDDTCKEREKRIPAQGTPYDKYAYCRCNAIPGSPVWANICHIFRNQYVHKGSAGTYIDCVTDQGNIPCHGSDCEFDGLGNPTTTCVCN